jgi:hypothetical protein
MQVVSLDPEIPTEFLWQFDLDKVRKSCLRLHLETARLL